MVTGASARSLLIGSVYSKYEAQVKRLPGSSNCIPAKLHVCRDPQEPQSAGRSLGSSSLVEIAALTLLSKLHTLGRILKDIHLRIPPQGMTTMSQLPARLWSDVIISLAAQISSYDPRLCRRKSIANIRPGLKSQQ